MTEEAGLGNTGYGMGAAAGDSDNDGEGNFIDISGRAGALATVVQVGRGLAQGDLDNDGDIDIVTSAACGRARLFENRSSPSGNWLIVRAYDAALKRDVYGAVTAAGRKIVRTAKPAFSYLSSSDPRAHFGLGDAQAVESIEVLWPDGLSETFPATCAGRVITLVRGEGRQRK